MRILVADHHQLCRDGIANLLRDHGHDVVAEVDNGSSAVSLARKLKPDVVFLELGMSGIDGVIATRVIANEMPGIKVVITALDETDDVHNAVRSGAVGYMLKSMPSENLFALLEAVERAEDPQSMDHCGQPCNPSEIDRPCDDEAPQLTGREFEVLALMVQGITSNRDLSEHLVVSENTVKYHLRNILGKLHLHNRAAVVALAVREGLVHVDE